jgi:hypothetical protein
MAVPPRPERIGSNDVDAVQHRINIVTRSKGRAPARIPAVRSGGRSAVLEGVLMECRLQWEEKKVPWIANIFVNAVFSDAAP